MTELKAERAYLYPVKSFAGVEQRQLALSPQVGVVGDRAMALAIDETPEEGDGVFRRKSHFIHGMRWPQIVQLSAETSAGPSSELRSVRRTTENGEAPVSLSDLIDVAAELAPGAPEARIVSAAPGEHFSDRKDPYLSIINLDTLEAFAAQVGIPEIAEPVRWRCNVYVRAGLGAEYGWVRDGAELTVGGARVRVEKLLGRCAMITAEPKFGAKDQPELMSELHAFEKAHGFEHPEERAPVMGVLAVPLGTATLQVG